MPNKWKSKRAPLEEATHLPRKRKRKEKQSLPRTANLMRSPKRQLKSHQKSKSKSTVEFSSRAEFYGESVEIVKWSEAIFDNSDLLGPCRYENQVELALRI